MKKKQVLPFIILTILFSSCYRDKINGNQTITFNNYGDTNLVKTVFNEIDITYIVQYENNSPITNYCYTNEGDTCTIPYLFSSNNLNKFFVYVPFGRFINDAQLLISQLDSNSIPSKDTLFYGIVSTGDTINIKGGHKTIHASFWGKNFHEQIEVFEFNRDFKQRQEK